MRPKTKNWRVASLLGIDISDQDELLSSSGWTVAAHPDGGDSWTHPSDTETGYTADGAVWSELNARAGSVIEDAGMRVTSGFFRKWDGRERWGLVLEVHADNPSRYMGLTTALRVATERLRTDSQKC